MNRLSACVALLCLSASGLGAQPFDDKFRQLGELLPTPGETRTASGAPGQAYWQQRADYAIKATLDEDAKTLTGKATVSYHNNSPDSLHYLWLQLDQNYYKPGADSRTTAALPSREAWGKDGVRFEILRNTLANREFDGGYTITALRNGDGTPLKYTVNGTMLRIDLPQPLKPAARQVFSIDWHYKINLARVQGGRTGYESFDDKNDLFLIAHWFPRMAAYYDAVGWQHKQYLGLGEFALDFGNYDVQLTVPSDHIVAATGELQNGEAILSAVQRERLRQARSATQPVKIVTQQEAEAAEKKRSSTGKTWHFKAANVRDFAFASSRKFIWDAQGYKNGGSDVLAMSYYPKEGNPLWEKYSTAAVVHTLEQYNKYAFDYPYPVAISVNGPIFGMEYPMISFNGPRPFKDRKTGEVSYSKESKYDLITVIIHEVGHNYFPMVVNSDERQWMWLDEGLNAFLQNLAEQAWEENYPYGWGELRAVAAFMKSRNQVPIMTNSESLQSFQNAALAKPAAALHVLRETVLGRELFDFALREYAQRWKFKRPTPADFFRTMEDASGTDLDWFWRGWFYTTDFVDVSVDGITEYGVSSKDPEVEKAWKKAQKDAEPISVTAQRNKGMVRKVDQQPELKDFYNEHDDFTVTNKDRNKYNETMEGLDDWEKALLKQGKHLYLVDFSNVGGLVTPLVLEIELKGGKKYIERIPAEVWRYSPKKITKLIVTDAPMVALVQDPYWETADTDTSNNAWPRKITPSRLELFKTERGVNDLMKDMKTPLKASDGKKTP